MSNKAESVGGKATLEMTPSGGPVDFVITPNSASGTGTVWVRSAKSPSFEKPQNNGSDVTVDLSVTTTITVDRPIRAFRVVSDNASDDFAILA